MAPQLGLFDDGVRDFADDARGRIWYVPSLLDVPESAALFLALRDGLAWSESSMWMYDRTVRVPRLIAVFGPGAPWPGALEGYRARVERECGVRFNAASVQRYRDGSDSVAWHNDHTEELLPESPVALLSLGAAREIRIRPKAPPRRALRCLLEQGSLFVMAGAAQHHYEHQIPKVAAPVGERISVAFRQRRSA